MLESRKSFLWVHSENPILLKTLIYCYFLLKKKHTGNQLLISFKDNKINAKRRETTFRSGLFFQSFNLSILELFNHKEAIGNSFLVNGQKSILIYQSQTSISNFNLKFQIFEFQLPKNQTLTEQQPLFYYCCCLAD
jgi:hypothetical protein